MDGQSAQALLAEHEAAFQKMVSTYGEKRARQMWMSAWESGSSLSISMSADDACNATYKAEFATLQAEFAKVGMSESDYVTSRRLDDGVDVLQPKLQPAATEATNWLASELNDSN